MKEGKKLLIVEDEENFGIVLKSYLEMNGYEVDLAKDGNIGWSKAMQHHYDLCILDVMMPYKDGFTLAQEVKEKKPDLPIIFLTAKGMKEDQIRGFKIGAEDYLTKPFDSELLLYKIKIIINRNAERQIKQEPLKIGGFSFDPKLRILKNKNGEKRLSPKESQLLAMLCAYKNDITPRGRALTEIWDNDDYFTKRSMDVYIAKIRKHLGSDESLIIENIHGEGYRLLEKNR